MHPSNASSFNVQYHHSIATDNDDDRRMIRITFHLEIYWTTFIIGHDQCRLIIHLAIAQNALKMARWIASIKNDVYEPFRMNFTPGLRYRMSLLAAMQEANAGQRSNAHCRNTCSCC